ncbi:hypothetical protein [Xanthomonas phage BUDD]|nr:hypothetical protein [Xanthomonas phage BUDD]
MDILFWLAVTFLGPFVLALPPAFKRLVLHYRRMKTFYVNDVFVSLIRSTWMTLIPAIGWFALVDLYAEEFIEPILNIKLKG